MVSNPGYQDQHEAITTRKQENTEKATVTTGQGPEPHPNAAESWQDCPRGAGTAEKERPHHVDAGGGGEENTLAFSSLAAPLKPCDPTISSSSLNQLVLPRKMIRFYNEFLKRTLYISVHAAPYTVAERHIQQWLSMSYVMYVSSSIMYFHILCLFFFPET